jgi:Protein of unknown function (DUF2924)
MTKPNVGAEIAALPRLTVKDLRSRYADVYGEPTKSSNKQWLAKRIAWRLQSLAEGDLSERARKRAAELARDADLRTTIPRAPLTQAAPNCTVSATLPLDSDRRLPPPGTVMTRKYKGGNVEVMVLPEGFAYAGTIYASLSAVAKAITGSHCNGYLFFRLNQKGGDR